MNHLFNHWKKFMLGLLLGWILIFSVFKRIGDHGNAPLVDGELMVSKQTNILPFSALNNKSGTDTRQDRYLKRFKRLKRMKRLSRGKGKGRVKRAHPGESKKIQQKISKIVEDAEGELSLSHLEKAKAKLKSVKKAKPGDKKNQDSQGEKKGKPVLPKKKKPKKADEQDELELDDEEVIADGEDEKDKADEKADEDSLGPPPIVFPAVTNSPTTVANDKDYEFWAQKLLDAPSFENLTDLIKAYQTNQVSKEVFFDLVDAMVEDGSSEYLHLAVIASGSTPSPRSFQILAGIMQRQPQGSPLRSEIETKFSYYGALNNVGDLRQVLSSSKDKFTILIAMKVLEDSVSRQLSDNTKTTGQSSGQPPRDGQEPDDTSLAARQAQVKSRVYQPFLGVLASLASGNRDPEVTKEAQSIHSLLSRLIG